MDNDTLLALIDGDSNRWDLDGIGRPDLLVISGDLVQGGWLLANAGQTPIGPPRGKLCKALPETELNLLIWKEKMAPPAGLEPATR